MSASVKSDYRILLASLDTFWLPSLQRGLNNEYNADYITTWSLKRSGPNPDLKRKNLWPLHYALQIYKMIPQLQFANKTYATLVSLFDSWVAATINPSDYDMFIPLSGVALWSSKKFRSKGKPVILECGSTHTDHQHRVVRQEYLRNGIRNPLFPDSYRDRIRREFELADYINLPTRFVASTFLEAGIPASKLMINPYGADLSIFRPRIDDESGRPFRVLCASGVNLRKGARVLAEAWGKLGWRDAELHWIGNPSDAPHLFDPMPQGICWHGWMPQSELAKLYSSCDVLVLPSFEEGFARVLLEGAASGLALIATEESGVTEFFSTPDPEGWLIEAGNSESLIEALREARSRPGETRRRGLRAAEKSRSGFGTYDYGRRACLNLQRVLS
jgi:glycosyltransferase involved in cell wall biosynthesis